MNNKKLYTGFLSVTAALALAACGNKQQSSSSVQDKRLLKMDLKQRW